MVSLGRKKWTYVSEQSIMIEPVLDGNKKTN